MPTHLSVKFQHAESPDVYWETQDYLHQNSESLYQALFDDSGALR